MRERVHFMGNGYAGELLDLIREGRSVNTWMSVYDFQVLRSQIGALSGVSLNGTELTVVDDKGTFLTTVSITPGMANGSMRFTERYRTVAYLLYDGLAENGYLLTENDELLLI